MIILVILAALASIRQAAGQSAEVSNATATTVLPTAEASVVEALLPESVEPNDTLIVSPNGEGDLYGNTVKLRESKAVRGDAYWIIIDTRHALPAGVLQYFHLFVVEATQLAPPSYLWLQIWRQDVSGDQFQLVWRRRVYLNDSSPQALYTFNVSDDNFHVREGDHIGWTGEDNNRFVSRDDDTSIPRCTDCTRSKYIVPDSKQVWFPTVRDEPYSGIQLSSRQLVFSAAVSISRPATTHVLWPVPPSPSTRAVPQTVSSAPRMTVTVKSSTTSTTTTSSRVIISADHTIAISIGVVFGIIGAVIVAITAIVIWKRRQDCTVAAIWPALKSKSVTRDSRVELLESDSSATASTVHSDDIDSASVTTSSSSEAAAAAAAGARDRTAASGLPFPAGLARPRHSAVPHVPGPRHRAQDPLAGAAAARPTYSKHGPAAARDNAAFVDDEVIAAKNDRQGRFPPQQQQPPQPSAPRVADTRTHHVSVELHSVPHEFADTDATGNVSMI